MWAPGRSALNWRRNAGDMPFAFCTAKLGSRSRPRTERGTWDDYSVFWTIGTARLTSESWTLMLGKRNPFHFPGSSRWPWHLGQNSWVQLTADMKGRIGGN